MKTLNLVQGSPEWKKHRSTSLNASDAPAMLGVSSYKSRSQLLKECATGILPEIDGGTQKRFNNGHIFEALARPLAEKIIGEALSPTTGVNEDYSASLDGIDFSEDEWFEHKSLNAELREILLRDDVTGADLPEEYQVQMEHQAIVCEGTRCLFMASKWEKSDNPTEHFVLIEEVIQYYNLVEELHCWYTPNPELRKRIIAGWDQFKKDLANYQHVEVKETPKAEAIQALPAVFVQATGMVTASNLKEFKEAATAFIAAIKTELVTDDDFAQAEATVKFCKEAETNLEATKSSVLAQMSSVDEVVRTLDHIKEQLANKRLMLDKLVKSEKVARKLAIVNEAINKFNAHIAELEAEIKPIRITGVKQDFASVISGLKSLTSMQDKVGAALANAKIALDTEAADIRKKLAWYNEATGIENGCFGFLFRDLQSIITENGTEAFKAIITSRIEKQKTVEAAKLETERVRIQAEEERKATAKAQAEAEAILAAERAKQAAEDQRGKSEEATHAEGKRDPMPQAPSVSTPPSNVSKLSPKPSRPSDEVIISCIANSFDVTYGQACDWILETADRMQRAA